MGISNVVNGLSSGISEMLDKLTQPARTTRRSVAVAAVAACAGTIAVSCGVVGFASDAAAAPPGTSCGTVLDVPGHVQPVIVLKGDVDCPTAIRIANRYLHDPSVRTPGGGSSGQATVEGWQCLAPLVPGRSHADSYLECDSDSGGFKIGN